MFLRRQIRWSGIPISLRIFHSMFVMYTVKGFGIINKAEIDVFLVFSCFFVDPTDVGNLIPGSSAFSKSSLNIWKYMVHIPLKPGLENFEHYFASMWDECNCVVVWTFFWHCLSLGLEWKLTFSSPVATAEFSKFAGILSGPPGRSLLQSFWLWDHSLRWETVYLHIAWQTQWPGNLCQLKLVPVHWGITSVFFSVHALSPLFGRTLYLLVLRR